MPTPSSDLPHSDSAESDPHKLEFAVPTKFNTALSSLWSSEKGSGTLSIDSNISSSITLQTEAMTVLREVQKNEPKNTRETLSQIKGDFMRFYDALGQMMQSRSPAAKPLSIYTYVMKQAGEHFEAFQKELLLDAVIGSVSLENRVQELTAETKDGLREALHPIDTDETFFRR